MLGSASLQHKQVEAREEQNQERQVAVSHMVKQTESVDTELALARREQAVQMVYQYQQQTSLQLSVREDEVMQKELEVKRTLARLELQDKLAKKELREQQNVIRKKEEELKAEAADHLVFVKQREIAYKQEWQKLHEEREQLRSSEEAVKQAWNLYERTEARLKEEAFNKKVSLQELLNLLNHREQQVELLQREAKLRLSEAAFKEQGEERQKFFKKREEMLRLMEETSQRAERERQTKFRQREEKLRLREEAVKQEESLQVRKSLLERKEEELKLREEAVELREANLLVGTESSTFNPKSASPSLSVPLTLSVYGSGDCISTSSLDADLRTAEAQFYRMMCARGAEKRLQDFAQVTQVDIVRIPSALHAFEDRFSLETRQLGNRPVLKFGFHGTDEAGLAGILQRGFRLDHNEVGKNGLTFGRGIYLSPRPRLAMQFTERHNCKLIMAVYMDVQAVKCHRVAEDGGAVVVPDDDLAYPKYVLHLSS